MKTKGLHKLCSVFEGVEERFISIIYKFVLGIGTKIFQKFKFPGGGARVPGGGMLKLLFDWYIIKTLSIYLKICTFEHKLCYQFESRQIFS